LRPTRPLAQPASLSPQAEPPPPLPTHPARASVASLQEYIFPFGSRLPSRSLLPHPSVKRAPTVSSVPHLWPPELGRAATASQPPHAAQLRASGAAEPIPPRLHSPLNSPLNPPPPSSMALKPLTQALTPATPPRRIPDPYKRATTTLRVFHPSLSFSHLLSRAGTPPLHRVSWPPPSHRIARPPHRRSHPGNVVREPSFEDFQDQTFKES
jgi:hypothetical protein